MVKKNSWIIHDSLWIDLRCIPTFANDPTLCHRTWLNCSTYSSHTQCVVCAYTMSMSCNELHGQWACIIAYMFGFWSMAFHASELLSRLKSLLRGMVCLHCLLEWLYNSSWEPKRWTCMNTVLSMKIKYHEAKLWINTVTATVAPLNVR